MSPSTRKKVLIAVAAVVGVLVVALLVIPSFLDLNKYKPELASQVKKATGRDLVIDGPVTLSLLPTPAVGVSTVRFVNMPGSKNANMVEVKSITVKPSILALLTGNIEVSEVILVEPKIVLEINTEGKSNWEFAPSAEEAKSVAAKPAASRPLTLGTLTIENGTLLFSDSKAGITMVGEKANITASVGSLDGPYSLTGGATLNGAPLKIDASIGAKDANGYAASLSLEANGKLGFQGSLSDLSPNARLGGTATVSTEQLATFITTLMGLAGQPAPVLPPLFASKFTFEGRIDASQEEFAAKDVKMALGDSTGAGVVSVKLKPAFAVDGKFVMPKLDLDKTLAALKPAASAAVAPATLSATSVPAAPVPAPKTASVLDGVTARLSVDIGEVIYNKQSIIRVAVELDARNGSVAVPRLNATLPGDMVLQAKSTMSGDPARPTVNGDFSLVGPKLRDTLKWLDVDVSEVPANKFTRLSFKGRMASSGGNIQVTDAAFELDDLKGAGGIMATMSVPISIVAQVAIDTVDVDSFMPPPGDKKASPAVAAKPATPVAAASPAVAGPSVGLKLKIARVIYRKQRIGGVDVDVALQDSLLKLNQFSVSDLVGARLAVRGTVANYAAPTRRPDIAFNFDAPDIDKVLAIFGGTATGLGKVVASGGAAGTQEQMNLRDVTVASGGDTVRMTGLVSMPGASTGTPSSVGYKGNMSFNNQTIDGTVEVKVADRPMITADLKASSLDLDGLQTRNAAPAARPPARGQPPAAATAPPIDTSAMRGVDASVKFAAGTLISSPMRLNNADLALTLKDGVLMIQHFKGALFGGTLALAGIVDASKPALAIDFKGDANNIIVGEMLRQTSGTNQFGSAIKVTIDGKLNATGITIKGSGSTPAQIKASMNGGATLGGHIFAGADKTLMMLGGAASGVVGGVIDNTLGSALGAIGQKGGIGAGNMLNAASLLLNRFVNRDNPITGHVDIAGGVLTDKGLAVQGNRATANISTRTNLVNSTTDTTVNFMIAEDTSGPYVTTTARGPISSPSLNVSRGSAKDPPGFVNTLTNGVTNGVTGGVQQAPSIIPRLPSLPNIFGR